MAYDKDYYINKKNELDLKLMRKKDQTLQEMSRILNNFWEDVRDIQLRYKEVEEQEKISQQKENETKKKRT